MRWKVKQPIPVGAIRYRTLFAITPIEVDGIIYWLESVDVKERYTEATCESYVNVFDKIDWKYTYKWVIIGLDDRP
jgi:hypothetical protein